ncbi:MAG: hypothetical protein JXR48_07180 [Candidatus Delongbacteria bacterium]|nr:hypothetical protein [Candidatus Delongbacteria bacterium]MBN2834734.1 hypothetical protein [Candidatus Delongbacteria bacterium]
MKTILLLLSIISVSYSSIITGGVKTPVYSESDSKHAVYYALFENDTLKISDVKKGSFLKTRKNCDIKGNYFYKIIKDSKKTTIKKKVLDGSKFYTLKGVNVSKFNKIEIDQAGDILVVNNDKTPLYVALSDPNKESKATSLGFIGFDPVLDFKEEILVSDNKEIKYYLLEPGKDLEFPISGKGNLKIVSRLLLDNGTSKQNYSYDVLNNDKLVRTVSGMTSLSKDFLVKDKEILLPSRGNSSVFVLNNSDHKIKVKNPSNNKTLLVRFLINKSAVSVSNL